MGFLTEVAFLSLGGRTAGVTLHRTRSASWLGAAAVMALALVASGCGVKGPLEPPMAAKAEGEAKSAEAQAPGENSAARQKPHEPFVLDGLLR